MSLPIAGAGSDSRLPADWQARLLDVDPSWAPVVERWQGSAAGRALAAFVDRRLAAGARVYPAQPLRALALTSLASARVVIIGQDPYHGPGQAEGLAFSVPPGMALPPSLRNILREWSRDLGQPIPRHGHLGAWARQGVLLLNTTLTVEDGLPASQAGRGWEVLTDMIVEALASDPAPRVFMLWGAHAQRRQPLIEAGAGAHRVLACNHPSPLSASRGPLPFVGCGHFGAAQAWLRAMGTDVDWRLDG